MIIVTRWSIDYEEDYFTGQSYKVMIRGGTLYKRGRQFVFSSICNLVNISPHLHCTKICPYNPVNEITEPPSPPLSLIPFYP
jgi:hypothetical protein